MTEIAVAGTEEFMLGFKLAGIRHMFNTEENPKETLEEAMNIEEVGVVVVDQETLDKLPEHFQEEIMSSVNPVILPLSEETDNSRLRDKITSAIGVDLMDR